MIDTGMIKKRGVNKDQWRVKYWEKSYCDTPVL